MKKSKDSEKTLLGYRYVETDMRDDLKVVDLILGRFPEDLLKPCKRTKNIHK